MCLGGRYRSSGATFVKNLTCLMICTFCHHMQNVGQINFGAGPLSLRMAPAVNLAVTVYSKPGVNTENNRNF